MNVDKKENFYKRYFMIYELSFSMSPWNTETFLLHRKEITSKRECSQQTKKYIANQMKAKCWELTKNLIFINRKKLLSCVCCGKKAMIILQNKFTIRSETKEHNLCSSNHFKCLEKYLFPMFEKLLKFSILNSKLKNFDVQSNSNFRKLQNFDIQKSSYFKI
jgi:hypothetical protein